MAKSRLFAAPAEEPKKPALKAIDTYWNGLYFRSRLEARWAVFYDKLGIRYEYEKEGYDLGDGIRYLPDFWLPEQDCFVEIKGGFSGLKLENKEIRRDAYLKCGRLAGRSGKLVYIATSGIGNVKEWDAHGQAWPPLHMEFDGTRDHSLEDASCPELYNWTGFNCWAGRCGHYAIVSIGDGDSGEFSDEILIAYRTARAMRFEEVFKPEWQTTEREGRTYARRLKT